MNTQHDDTESSASMKRFEETVGGVFAIVLWCAIMGALCYSMYFEYVESHPETHHWEQTGVTQIHPETNVVKTRPGRNQKYIIAFAEPTGNGSWEQRRWSSNMRDTFTYDVDKEDSRVVTEKCVMDTDNIDNILVAGVSQVFNECGWRNHYYIVDNQEHFVDQF